MTIKINQRAYPFIEQVKNFPIYLTGIGGTEHQNAVSRPKGYCFNQILFCGDGSGILRYDNVTVEITANCYIFLPAYYPHEYIPDNVKWDMRWVVFDGYACSQIFSEFGVEKACCS